MLYLFLRQAVVLAAISMGSVAAYAGPVTDVSDWAHKFNDAALVSDFSAMQRLINDASDPRLKMDHALETVAPALRDLKVVSVEQFDNQELGTFFKRVRFAVLYEHSIFFYSFEFAREVDGWQIIGMGADGNINNILSRPWPH